MLNKIKAMNINLEAAVKRIMAHGPDHAREQYNLNPEVIFIRNDGWTLGAPRGLEWIAFQQWAGEWIGFLRKPDREAHPMTDYKPLPNP
jgi:hypothetical protein